MNNTASLNYISVHIYYRKEKQLYFHLFIPVLDGEDPVMLELLGMWRTLLLPSLPAPLWPGVVALDRVLSLGQIELNCVLMLN